MRIVHVTTVPETLRFFSGQISYMQKRGVEIHAISSPGELLNRFGADESVPVHAVNMQRRITPLSDCVATIALIRLFRSIRPDIVHGHTPKAGLLAMIAAWLARVPVRLFHLHGLPHSTATGLRRSLLRIATKVSCSLADHVLSVSGSVRRVVVEEGICSPQKVNVLLEGSSNGIDAAGRFRPGNVDQEEQSRLRERYGLPPDAFVIGFVGRFVRDKGLVDLAAVFAELEASYANLHLLLVGDFEPHDPLPPNIEALYRQHPRVHMTGWLPDASPLYSLMDILVLPSYREGFPNVLLEAAAMEIPVVATDVVGCTDAVLDGKTGRLIPPANSSALRNALEEYIQNPDIRLKHAKAGRSRVLAEFQPEPLWSALYQTYGRIWRDKGRRGVLWERRLKRALDVVASAIALIILSPILLLIAFVVRLSMGGPVLFRQVRPGRNGCPFTLLKFRTMLDSHDKDGQPLPDRERLTVLGRWLRKWSLDELPALYNVICGDMSLVGPRPLLMQYLPYFTERERLRFSVPPGITGWAQVHGRNFSPWEKRFADDVWYVENWSLSLDMRILFLTIGRVLRADGVAPDSYIAVAALDEERKYVRPRTELFLP